MFMTILYSFISEIYKQGINVDAKLKIVRLLMINNTQPGGLVVRRQPNSQTIVG